MDKGILVLILGILLVGSVSAMNVNQTINQTVTAVVINGTKINNESHSPLCAFKDTNVTLSANISFKDCSGNVWVFVNNGNGTWTNYTVTNSIGSVYYFVLNSLLLEGGANVSFQFYAKDCYNFTYNGSIKSFYVRGNTQLIVNPLIPDGLNNWYVSEPLFSLIKDSLGGNRYYQWDSDDTFLYAAPFGLENIPNPKKETAGTLELNWWTDFGVCGNETSENQTFYIDLTNPLITDLTPENNSIVYNNLRPIISAYLDDVYGSNSGINDSSIIMKLDNVSVTPIITKKDNLDRKVTYVPQTDLGFGEHEVYVYCKDNSGRNSEITWSFNIKLTPVFGLQVNSPDNIIYDSKRIAFNITTTDEVEKIEYINYYDNKPRWKILCRNCDEYGLLKKKTQTLNEGWNNITIKATDEFGQMKEENITLFIDSKAPVISKTEPKRNSVINGSEFYIKYTEDNLQKVELFWNPSQELNCFAGKNQECRTFVDLSAFDGNWIEYYFEVSDSINIVQSKKTRVLVDTTSPILTINSPKNQIDGETYDRRVPFNITISEDVLLEYIDNSVASPRWRRLTSNSDEYGNTRKKTLTFKRGIHKIQIRATDRAGNSDIEAISFEVDY
jgi:hypothetical protein